MGYRGADWGYITGTDPMCIAYTLNGGTESGAQFAQAIPKQGPYNVSLVNNNHTTEWARSINTFTYYFWVRNETGASTWFDLAGGGF